MFKVGYYKNMTVPSPNVITDINLIFDGVKNGKWRSDVERYRKSQNSSIKDNLPCYTVGGVFGGTKAIDKLKEPSNLLSLDVDDFDGGLDKLVGSYLSLLGSSLFHISKSCGGKGYCVIVKIKRYSDYDHFKKIYHSVYMTLERAGLGKVSKFDYLPNLNRLRFVSYDPASITFDLESLQDWTEEEELPINVSVSEKGKNVTNFVLEGQRLSDEQKFEQVLSKYVEFKSDFGVAGTRHDWVLGLARWCCRADIDEGWLLDYILAHYQNSARSTVWSKEVIRCVRDSYRAYSAERGSFEVIKRFDYEDILSCTNVEQVKEQVYFLIADKLNYKDKLVSEKKSCTFVEKEIMFLKTIANYL